MTTYSLQGFSFTDDAVGTITSFTPGQTLDIVVTDGEGVFVYETNPPVAPPGTIPEVDIEISGLVNARLNGANAIDTGLEATLGFVQWDDDGVARETFILQLEDPFTNLKTVFEIGGDPLPDFANITDISNFVFGQVTGDGPITSGPFAPGVDIPLSSFLDVGISENDTIVGTLAVDSLEGGVGDDTIEGLDGDDIIDGGDDEDTAIFSGVVANYSFGIDGSGNIVVTDNVGTDGTDTLIDIETLQFADQSLTPLFGTSGNDTLQGTTLGDVIFGLDGDDSINASNSGDVLMGGAGNDTLIGGAGGDIMDGGTNTAVGDTASYVNSNAAVFINLGADTASGGHADGDDLNNIENLLGSVFNDTLTGDAGSNTINGFRGNDTIDGGLGDDLLEGGLGNDTFISSTGADTFNGGTGNDTADYSGSNAGVIVQINNGGTVTGGHATGDTLVVENIVGSDFADDINGNTVGNELSGGNGDDTFNASSGNDTINGGAGDDFILGSRGGDIINGGSNTAVGDTASYSNSDARVVVDLDAGTATGSGHGSGDTLIDIENVFGSRFNDDIFGDDENNVLDGFNGVDELFGRGGNDTLNGGGNLDYLNGGAGNDTLSGGGGFDRFMFDDANFGQDNITDFSNNQELMDMRGSGLTYSDLTIAQVGGDTVITVTGTSNTITLDGITSVIDENDFMF